MNRAASRAVLVADSGVWVDFFNGTESPAAQQLAGLLQGGEWRIVVPDLVLFEVLRGFRFEADFRRAQALLGGFDIESTGGGDLAASAAQHYRALRSAGFTVRSAPDVMLATFCIEHDYALLHNDRDFVPFESLRGLKAWPVGPFSLDLEAP
jgi:predicted nucleic acid-binding protein